MTSKEAMQAIADAGGHLEWPVYVALVVTIGACVMLHYEAIHFLLTRVSRRLRSPRQAIITVVLSLIGAHIVEILLFGAAYWTLDRVWGVRTGALVGDFHGALKDYGYFSAAVYTTVGFGDITPVGSIRLLTAAEALAGLVLVTWSASFTFLIMQERLRMQGGPG